MTRALAESPHLYQGLGRFHYPIGTRNAKVQAWFNQGMLLAFGFNHAESQRAFRGELGSQ